MFPSHPSLYTDGKQALHIAYNSCMRERVFPIPSPHFFYEQEP